MGFKKPEVDPNQAERATFVSGARRKSDDLANDRVVANDLVCARLVRGLNVTMTFKPHVNTIV